MKVLTATALVGVASAVLLPNAALAHFQMLYGGHPARTPGPSMEMALVFTHPFTGGPTMEMGHPESFSLTHQQGDGEPETIDLIDTLEPIEWTGPENTAAAYHASIPGRLLRSLGDYTFTMTPSPYYEGTEDKYIQQITKMMVNVGGVPGNWDQALGLPTEIVAHNKPYANWVGGVFSGTVLSAGEPVPNAEIEIEYVNFEADVENNAWAGEPFVQAPQAALEILSIRADAQGNFAIGLPREGWWGIGALGVGPDTEHEGKELSQDAILWVYATAMD